MFWAEGKLLGFQRLRFPYFTVFTCFVKDSVHCLLWADWDILTGMADLPKPRWYRLTPDRLIVGLLIPEAFLLLLQWFLLLLVPGCSTAEVGEPPMKVLFIGNSYTSVNDLPSLVAALADRWRAEDRDRPAPR